MKRSLRYVFNGLAVLSLLLCCATVAIWLSGGWVNKAGHFKSLAGRWAYLSVSQRGLVQLVLLHHSRQIIVGPIIPTTQSSPAWDSWNRQFSPSARWHAEQYGF